MTDRPILFSAPMVRGILEGRKTQTRRCIQRLLKFGAISDFGASDTEGYDWHFRDREKRFHDLRHSDLIKYLPVAVGDRLWVRETWADVNGGDEGPGFAYKVRGFRPCRWDADPVEYSRYPKCSFTMWYEDLLRGEKDHSWRPSIFMPRSISRITLIVESVRVERLQDISEEDAIAEGIYLFKDGDYTGGYKFAAGEQEFDTATEAYADLWDRINGKTPDKRWSANPRVAAVSFTPIFQNIEEVR